MEPRLTMSKNPKGQVWNPAKQPSRGTPKRLCRTPTIAVCTMHTNHKSVMELWNLCVSYKFHFARKSCGNHAGATRSIQVAICPLFTTYAPLTRLRAHRRPLVSIFSPATQGQKFKNNAPVTNVVRCPKSLILLMFFESPIGAVFSTCQVLFCPKSIIFPLTLYLVCLTRRGIFS